VFQLTSQDYGKLNPNCYGPVGFFEDCTPLHQAAARGHLETVEKLVLCGAEMDAKDHKHHATPRDWAAKAGKEQVVELLDQMQQYMPIVFAARQGDLAKLGELLDANPQWLDTPIPNGATMLMDLCNINTPLKNVGKTIAYLIKRGANPNQTLNRDGTGETPLHWAASFGPNIKHGPEAINALLDHGAHIDATGSVLGNGTPLVNAVIFRDLDSAKLLIERGAKFDMALAAGVGRLDLVKSFFDDSGKFHNPYGNMPHRDSTSDPQGEMNMAILLAGMHGHRACIAWLLEKGAQINTVSIVKTTCLDELINHGYEQTANWLRQQGALTYKQLQEQEAGNE
ncbi:MAG: ankyrin repeat domain-containing protein, partial [Phycisphaeraceae bacterium JB051]